MLREFISGSCKIGFIPGATIVVNGKPAVILKLTRLFSIFIVLIVLAQKITTQFVYFLLALVVVTSILCACGYWLGSHESIVEKMPDANNNTSVNQDCEMVKNRSSSKSKETNDNKRSSPNNSSTKNYPLTGKISCASLVLRKIFVIFQIL